MLTAEISLKTTIINIIVIKSYIIYILSCYMRTLCILMNRSQQCEKLKCLLLCFYRIGGKCLVVFLEVFLEVFPVVLLEVFIVVFP